MCAAVVPEVSPENDADTIKLWARGSIVTVTNPVPREGVGSLGPFKTAVKVIGSAKATELIRRRIAKTNAAFMVHLAELDCRTGAIITAGSAIVKSAATSNISHKNLKRRYGEVLFWG
jgi:hypothetical protein